MNQFFHKLSVVTRAKDWRLSFVPFIMGCVYMWLWWFELPFTVNTILLTFLSLITTVGFASLGYFINEFFDKASDAKAGKINKLAFLSPQVQAAIFVSAVSLTITPWIWLPTTDLSYLLIALQIALFLIYSLPFPRLKESTYLSVIIDSLYAYVVPLVLSFYTFSLIARATEFPLWFYLFVAAVFFIGLRNIIIHQVNDVMKDRKTGMVTLPMVLGVVGTRNLVATVVLYELLFITLWVVSISIGNWLFWSFGIVFSTIIMLRQSHFYISADEMLKGSFITNSIYQYVFPVFVLLLTLFVDYKWMFVLLPIHFLFLFPHYILVDGWKITVVCYNHFIVLYWNVRNYLRHLLSVAVNVPIYYAFRLCGIDLIKEKKSALSYLKKKLDKV